VAFGEEAELGGSEGLRVETHQVSATTRQSGRTSVAARSHRNITYPSVCPAVSSQFATPGSRPATRMRNEPSD
jgi:hypothetical protein